MTSNYAWYEAYLEANNYKVGNIPEFLFVVFPSSLNRRDSWRIRRHNRALGFRQTMYYKKRTIMVSYIHH